MHFTQPKWQKKGLIIKPNEKIWWMHTHAMLPTPLQVDNSIYKIFFGGRNEQNQSHTGYAVIDLNEPDKVLEYSSDPVLKPGRLGAFDDNGVLPSCYVPQENEDDYLYFIGFKPGGTTRMDLFGGLSLVDTAGNCRRWSEAPIIERCRANPFINTAPWVIRENKGFRMYYVAGIEWVHKDLPRYNIQTATSADGKEWHRDGTIAIDFAEGENALARPYVTKKDSIYRMWFSSKGNYYLPHYAESEDGINWIRDPNGVNLKPTAGGPDQEMICYPIVLEHNGRQIMYYNGNGYGLNGICLAVEE